MSNTNTKSKQANFQSISDIFQKQQKETPKKTTSHEWQSFALRIIQELSIPGFKRGAVFKVCKEKPKEAVERCLNDTKELCKTGDKWKYFFKVVGAINKPNQGPINKQF